MRQVSESSLRMNVGIAEFMNLDDLNLFLRFREDKLLEYFYSQMNSMKNNRISRFIKISGNGNGSKSGRKNCPFWKLVDHTSSKNVKINWIVSHRNFLD